MADPTAEVLRGGSPPAPVVPGAGSRTRPGIRRVWFALALSLLSVSPAAAEDARPSPQASPDVAEARSCRYCASRGGSATPNGLHWHYHWSRTGARELISVPLLFAVGVIARDVVPPRATPLWRGPILLDDAAREALRIETPEGRQSAKVVSDLLLFGSFAHTVLIDNVLVSWLGRGSPDVAQQMAVINAHSYGLTFFLAGATKWLTGRERPSAETCSEGDETPRCAGRERYRAFYSGHAAMTATSAGLLCAHHTQLQLYQDPLLDTATCVIGIGMTATTGAMRIASDNHWTSDVLVGHLMGYLSGYLVPTLSYYHEFRIRPEPEGAHRVVSASIVPMPLAGGAGLGLVGTF